MLASDVLIAGGGPCGLMLAIELGRRGIKCLLVDAKQDTAFNPQANATQARTMEHFRRLGFATRIRSLGLPADHPTDIAYFTRFSRYELARIQLPTAAQAALNIKSLTGSWSAAELPHRVSQKFVERELREQAQALPSVQVRFGWRLEDFRESGQCVTANLCPSTGGQAQHVQAQFLVGADGARSLVRRRLGIQYGGSTGIAREFMGGKMFAIYFRAPTLAQLLPHSNAWMYVSVNSERRAFMATVDGAGEYALHAALRPNENADDWDELDARRVLKEVIGLEVPAQILSTSTWIAGHSLVAEHFQQGRVFIAGDAAHLFTPTGGLGYNTAVEDGVNLGWKLASVLQGKAPFSLLESYEQERRPLAIRNTGFAKQFADSIGLFVARPQLEEDSVDGQLHRANAGEYLSAHARLEFNIPGVTFGGRYDNSSVILQDGRAPLSDDPNHYLATASPGGRPPHAWLDDGRSLFDLFHHEWTLLVLGTNPPPFTLFENTARDLNLDLLVVRVESEYIRELYEAPLALIRPDQIVAWRGDTCAEADTVMMRAIGRLSTCMAAKRI